MLAFRLRRVLPRAAPCALPRWQPLSPTGVRALSLTSNDLVKSLQLPRWQPLWLGLRALSLTPDHLDKLGVKSLSDAQLKAYFDQLRTDEAGIKTGVFAERLTLAHGFDPNALTQSGAQGGVYGTDLGASAFRLLMRWTASRVDTNHDGVISFEEFHTAVRETEASLVESSFFDSTRRRLRWGGRG